MDNLSPVELEDAISDHSVLDSAADILCGSLAGASGKVFEYPFDTIKVRLQSQPSRGPLRYSGPWDCFKQSIAGEGGVLGLYRGIGPPLVGAAAENAVLFMSYNLVIDHVGGNSLAAGAISGMTASFLLTPIELIKCQIQVQDVKSFHKERQGVVQVIASILKSEGLQGFWRGQTGTLLREAGGSAAWFGAYNYAKTTLKSLRSKDLKSEESPVIESLISGACAGIAYNLSLFPADTIKSQMQTHDTKAGFFETGKKLYGYGGIPALYRGLGVTLLRAVPSNAIIFFLYETSKGQYEKHIK